MIYTCGLDSSGYGYIAALAVDSSTGGLTLKNSVSESSFADGFRSLAVSPAGDYLYALSYDSAIFIYSISSSTGAITYAGECSTHQYGSTIRLDKTGSLAFVATADGYLESFSVSGGAVALIASVRPSTLSAYGRLVSVAVDSAHAKVYAVGADTSNNGTIYPYAYASNGTLTAGTPVSIVSSKAPQYATVDSTGSYLYIGVSASIVSYAIGADGAPSLKAKASDTSTIFSLPMGIAFAPSGKYAYAVDLFGAVDECALSGGVFTTFGSVSTKKKADGNSSNPQSIAIDSAGKYVYVADRDIGYIEEFSVSSSDASLSAADTTSLDGSRLMDIAYLQ